MMNRKPKDTWPEYWKWCYTWYASNLHPLWWNFITVNIGWRRKTEFAGQVLQVDPIPLIVDNYNIYEENKNSDQLRKKPRRKP